MEVSRTVLFSFHEKNLAAVTTPCASFQCHHNLRGCSGGMHPFHLECSLRRCLHLNSWFARAIAWGDTAYNSSLLCTIIIIVTTRSFCFVPYNTCTALCMHTVGFIYVLTGIMHHTDHMLIIILELPTCKQYSLPDTSWNLRTKTQQLSLAASKLSSIFSASWKYSFNSSNSISSCCFFTPSIFAFKSTISLPNWSNSDLMSYI